MSKRSRQRAHDRAVARASSVTLAAALPLPGGALEHPATVLRSRMPEQGRLARPRDLYSLPGRQQVTPERLSACLSDLNQGRYEIFADTMTQMATSDPDVRRAYDIRRGAVAGRPFECAAPAKCDPLLRGAADDLAGMVQTWLDSLDSPQAFLMRLLDAIGMGISAHELLWSKRGGLWLPDPVPIMTRELRHERDWSVSVRDRDYEWINMRAHPGRFLVHMPSTNNARPVDQGAFLATMFYWLFKRGGIQFWMSGAERFGNPLALAKMAVGADLSQKLAALADLQQATADTVGVVSGVSDIEIIEAKAAGGASAWKELTAMLVTEIFLSLGVSPDLILTGPNGSRASTGERKGIMVEGTKLDAAMMWGSVVRDVVTWIAYYNMRRSDVPFPVLKSTFDDAVAVTRDAIDVGAVDVNEVRARLGLAPWTEAQGGKKIAALPVAPAYPGAQPAAMAAVPLAAEPSPGGAPASPPFPPAESTPRIFSPSRTR
jgi:hypothetical protein